MSTVNVSNIITLNSGVPIIKNSNDVEIGQFCRAWVNFNCATLVINDDFNVASYTDHGTGEFTFTFDTALPDTTYCISGSGKSVAAYYGTVVSVNTLATTSFRIIVWTANASSHAVADPTLITVAVFGN